MRKLFLIPLLLLGVSLFAQDLDIDFGRVESLPDGNRYVDFKLMRNGSKVSYMGLEAADCKCFEVDKHDVIELVVDSLSDITKGKLISKDLSVVILVDNGNSMKNDDFDGVKNALTTFVHTLPDPVKVYISTMDTLNETRLFDKHDDLAGYLRNELFNKSSNGKSLYASIISAVQEIGNVPENSCRYKKLRHNQELANDTVSEKIIFLLSGNPLDPNDGSFFQDKRFFTNRDSLRFPEDLKAFYCIYFGEKMDEKMEDEFKYICKSVPGGKLFPQYSVDSLKNILIGSIDSIAMDYRIYYSVKDNHIYNGESLKLTLDIEKLGASGNKEYSYGSTLETIDLGGDSKTKASVLVLGLVFGILFIAFAYLVMQFLVPWIQYMFFKKKYVKTFSSKDNDNDLISQQCYYCKDNFEEGDTIVTKCKHTLHWDCWEENQCRCPEYGINNCKDGIYYYNRKHLSDERNSPYYTSWLLAGLLGGLLTWILFRIIPSEKLFPGLIEWLVEIFDGDKADLTINMYLSKIQPLLLCGIVLGFSVTFLFSYLIEFRKKTWKLVSVMLARSIGNALVGFLAFLLGSVVVIAMGKSGNCMWTDWIPWLFFGCGVPWLISFKTDIRFKEAFQGGLFSVLLSFVAIYLIRSEVIGMFGFMVYAAGLGSSIAVVHYISENYFLHIEGPTKERDIAIYKWMNVAGGFNHVTIGRSPHCVIEMNWDDSELIRDKQVELYIENDYPYCLALTDGTTMGPEHRPLKAGESILLVHGQTFVIGNTKFTYIEKDK